MRETPVLILGITPGKQQGREEGLVTDLASLSCPRLRVEGDASLICLACSASDRHCSWPQDQVGGNCIFSPPLVVYHYFPDGICSGLDLTSAPTRSPLLQDAHSAWSFHPIRVCRCWAVSEDGTLGVSSWHPGKSVIH